MKKYDLLCPTTDKKWVLITRTNEIFMRTEKTFQRVKYDTRNTG